MASWYGRLLFRGDRLLDAGVHEVIPDTLQLVPDPDVAPDV